MGAIARYKLGGLILHHTAAWRFPISTFAVNMVGCLAIGVVAGLAEKYQWNQQVRVFLMPGLLGGFTTFSAFAYEGMFLIQRGQGHIAAMYAVGSVLCGLAGVWTGMKISGG